MQTSEIEKTRRRTVQSALYRLAKRKGFYLRKCRSRTPSDPEYGNFVIGRQVTNMVEHMKGLNGYGLTLDDVAEYLEKHSAV
jgi:hypothetical protein